MDISIFSSLPIVSTTITLFLLMDSLGNIPIYLALLKDVSPKRQLIIIFRESVIALITILFFTYFGPCILKLLHISQQSLAISGGIILFIFALRMIFSNAEQQAKDASTKYEPCIVPLAIPLVAGPSILATVMIYSSDNHLKSHLFIAILIAWAATTLILLSAPLIRRFLGERGISAIEKLMGLILTLIAVQLFLDGIKNFFQT